MPRSAWVCDACTSVALRRHELPRRCCARDLPTKSPSSYVLPEMRTAHTGTRSIFPSVVSRKLWHRGNLPHLQLLCVLALAPMSHPGTEMHSTRRASFALFLPMANWRCRRCSTSLKCEICRWGRGAHAGLGRVRATMGVLATKDEAMMNTTKQPLPSAASCKASVVPSTESRRGRTVFCKSSPCRRSRTTLCRVAASYTCPQGCR
mmetsp:Transcript_1769/g.5729  ORF Transcript_1769/g.5729 Transcript_1769/m.5729 type:complete len:206 (+) Transcript_1769:492-1109(+)